MEIISDDKSCRYYIYINGLITIFFVADINILETTPPLKKLVS